MYEEVVIIWGFWNYKEIRVLFDRLVLQFAIVLSIFPWCQWNFYGCFLFHLGWYWVSSLDHFYLLRSFTIWNAFNLWEMLFDPFDFISRAVKTMEPVGKIKRQEHPPEIKDQTLLHALAFSISLSLTNLGY